MENGKIYEAISNVMAEIGAIGKEKKNLQQGFMYRGIDDVMNALQPALVKNKVFIAPEVISEQREERTTQKGGVLFYTRLEVSYKFYTVDGSFIETKIIGEAMDSGDKATNKAMSIAYKYACFQVFCIPTEEMQDPDADTYDINGKQSNKKKETKSANKPTQQSNVPKSEQEMNEKAAAVAKQKIGQAKLAAIQKELDRTGISAKAVCAREEYDIASLEDITEALFPRVMNALKKTSDKKGVK
ncbi:ERF family protein [Anaerocolumna sp.]|uniref:ERF family protein n=1 Tax=Anaerocolumna sp. TaxID=2041569 RepID=UPI0028A6641A|nr:ERF family protein [Anaerocolumna sp.]